MRECPACGEANPDRARFCLGCGHELPVDETALVAESRRTVTVVFADLAGSTVLGESLDAEPLRYVTGRYFDTMRAAVERHGGTVEKFIGDAVVAVFGLPRIREDDALRAVRTAADMRDALPALNEELSRQFDVRVEIRVGVNTGEVVVGEARAGGSRATGDAVNVAARLEQAAEPGEVLVGDATYRLVRDHVDVEPVEPLTLKGKAQRVGAWRLLRLAAEVHRGLRTSAFVGREPQLRVLADSVRRATDERACQLVTVLGAAGMGKSRLAEEFAASIGDTATVLFGHCLSYGQGATYWPLRQAVLTATGLTGEEDAGRFTSAVRDVLGNHADADSIVSRLVALTGHKEDTVPEDMGWAVRTFLESLASSRPVVLVVDDLHWAEPGLLDLVEHIADWSRDAPIVLLGLARPEFLDHRPTWGGGKLNATSMLLTSLDDEATAGLIDRHDLPVELRHRIIDAAGGNPLFAEQLVAALVDQGQADYADGIVRWRDSQAADTPVTLPPSISALLTARIDQLSHEERIALGCAAVVGAVFYVEAVAAVIESPPDRVRALLDGLVRRELLRPTVSDLTGGTAYRFLHALVRDAAYDGLAKQSRAQWHERVADWLLSSHDAVVPDEIVGHHLASAWDYWRQIGPPTDHTQALARRAAERLAAAAARLELSDVAAAAALTERAVAMLDPGDPLHSDCLIALGEQRFDLGQVRESTQVLETVAASSHPQRAELAKVLLYRVNTLTADYRIEDGSRIVADALQRFAEWRDDRGLAWAHLVAAEIESLSGLVGRSLQHLLLSIDHAKAAGDAGCAARARALIGVFYLFGPTPAEQVIAATDVLLVESRGDPRVRAEVEQVTCVMHAMCGRFDRARQLSTDCKQHLAEVGHGLFLANVAQSTAHVEELAGDLDAAEVEYERSEEALDRLGESAYLSTVAGLHARLLTQRGKRADALRAIELARANGSADDVMTQSLILQAEARLAADDGDKVAARSALRFLDLENPQETPDGAGEAYLVAADVEAALGDLGKEREHLEAALRAFRTKGNTVRAEQVAARLA